MSTYPNSQLMRANFSSLQGLRAKQYANTASEHNAAATEICRTYGDATLADFCVAPSSRSTATPASSLLEIASRSQSSIVNLG